MKDHNFDLRFLPDKHEECRICLGDPRSLVGSSRLDDVAMELAKRGASYHEIVHVMLTYASLAADRAIMHAMRVDERNRTDDAEAKWDTSHGKEYEDPES